MAREGTVMFGIVVPDYVTDADVYHAVDKAAETLEEHHITAEHQSVQGLNAEDLVEEPQHLADLRDEAAEQEGDDQ
jgi:hypothetical protein